MSGFLPFLTASTGAAPKMATEAVPSQTGTDGAFGAVLAGVMEDAAANVLPVEAGSAPEPAMPFAPLAEARAAGADLSGSALRRLHLALADAGLQPGLTAVRASLAGSAAMLAAAPAAFATGLSEAPVAQTSAVSPQTGAGTAAGDGVRVARPVAADASDEASDAISRSEVAAADEAQEAAVAAAPAPAQSLPPAAPAAAPAPALNLEADGEDPAAGIVQAEFAAGETDAADATRREAAIRQQVRPVINAAPAEVIQPAPPPAVAAAASAEAAPALAALAPAAGTPHLLQGTDAVRTVVQTAVQTAAADAENAAAGLPPALAGARDAIAPDMGPGVAEILAAIAPDAGRESGLEVPVAAIAEDTAAARTAPAAKSAGAGQPARFADKAMIDPAAGTAQADVPAEPADAALRAAEPSARPVLTADQSVAQPAQPAPSQTNSTQPDAVQPNSAQPNSAQPEAVQPVPGQPASAQPQTAPSHADQVQARQALSHGADVVRVATPQQVPEAVGLAISRHVGAQATEFTLRLDPAELGRIEVKLELGKDGQAIVSVQADNASTYDLLRRDSHALERALAEAGLKLDSGGLNFSLRQQDGQNPQQFAGDAAPRQATGRMQEAALAGSDPDTPSHPVRRSSAAGLLDLSI